MVVVVRFYNFFFSSSGRPFQNIRNKKGLMEVYFFLFSLLMFVRLLFGVVAGCKSRLVLA